MTTFSQLKLQPDLLKIIENQGYKEPSPIQGQAIPHLLKGKDLLGIAQTGTGKTAAFALPLISNFLKNKIKTRPKQVRALILTPTRELANQVSANIANYSQGMSLHCGVVFGGVKKSGQVKMLTKGCDVLVATPGRLLDLMDDRAVKFDQLEVFILDEADKMLDMGFIRPIEKIMSKLPKERQTMLFSATMPKAISSLANSLLKNPVRVEVTPESSTVEKIDQKIYMVNRVNKLKLLKNILNDKAIKSALVFSRTKHLADRINKELFKSNISSVAIHGNKSQGAREKALKTFKSGHARVLIATDIAARGIDIDHITHVINYNIPEDAESYVHRIGRTARAGRDGKAISFCEATEVKLLKNVEKFIKYKIPVHTDHMYHIHHSKEDIASEEKNKKEQKEKRLEMRRKSRPKSHNPQNSRTNPRSKKSGSSLKKKPIKRKR